MAALTPEEHNALLRLARSSIEAKLTPGLKTDYPQEISSALQEKRGCFVTLHKKGTLRGCIGTIEPMRSLVANVEENAINAAFGDPRFPALEKKELPSVEIEISVLTKPAILGFEDGEDLKKKLKPGIHGVILTQGCYRSTFLPQVWKQLPDKEAFLECLCQKGGMEKTCWMDKRTTVEVYEVECFAEVN